jgi:hypothetical protein
MQSAYHEQHADEQNDGWEELEAERNQPSCIGLGLSGATDVVRAFVKFISFWLCQTNTMSDSP